MSLKPVALLNEEDDVWRAAVDLTGSQINEAVRILQQKMPDDIRTQEGALIGSVVQALATNFQSLIIAHANFAGH